MMPTYLWITCMVIVISFLQSTDGGVNVSLSSSTVDLKTKEPLKISMLCSLEGNTRINTIYSIKILRKSKRQNEFVIIEQSKFDQSPEMHASSQWNIIDKRISTDIHLYEPASSQIKLEFNTKYLACEDSGEYKCTAVFDYAHNIRPVIEDATDALENRSLNIGRDAFQCYFKCFGGTAAMGIGGVMTLVVLMPAIWFD